MFDEVNKKLERAAYCLRNLKALESDANARGFAFVAPDRQQEMRANLDCFLFEIVSAKDFFLQGINDSCRVGLPKNEATIDLGELRRRLEQKDRNASKVVERIQRLLSRKSSWLWRLNNYRNSSTHRELLHLGIEADVTWTIGDKGLFDKMKKAQVEGTLSLRPIFKGRENEIPPDTPRLLPTREDVKTYLFKDPEDPSQGNMDIEVIPYCEQSLQRMRGFLEQSYSKLGI